MRLQVTALVAAALFAAPLVAEVPLDPNSTAMVRLSPQGSLAYPAPPKPPQAPANFGAILSIDIDEPGRYDVALSASGRIDLFNDGTVLAAVDQRDGAPGSGVARIATYDLATGHYTVALSGMKAGEISITVSR